MNNNVRFYDEPTPMLINDVAGSDKTVRIGVLEDDNDKWLYLDFGVGTPIIVTDVYVCNRLINHLTECLKVIY